MTTIRKPRKSNRHHTRLAHARQAQAIAREGPQEFAHLKDLAGVSVAAMIRWATKGLRGHFLDAVYDRGTQTWYTSAAAVARFRQATAPA